MAGVIIPEMAMPSAGSTGKLAGMRQTSDGTPFSVCAWCKRLRGPDGIFLALRHFEPERHALHVSHGICPKCFLRERSALRGRRDQRSDSDES